MFSNQYITPLYNECRHIGVLHFKELFQNKCGFPFVKSMQWRDITQNYVYKWQNEWKENQ